MNTLVQEWNNSMKKDLTASAEELGMDSARTIMKKDELCRWAQGGSFLSNSQRQLTLEKEIALGRKALILVRRAALQNLLEQERRQYIMELSLIGKAFYNQRI